MGLGLKVNVTGVEEVPKAKPAAGLGKLRDLHHRIARLLAMGMQEGEVSARVGVSPTRISLLKNDPTFAELLEFYRKEGREIFRDVLGQLKSLAADATSELHDRLVDAPEAFSIKQLMELSTMALDRTGFSPTVKLDARHVHLTSDDIRAMKEAMDERVTIDGATAVRQKPEADADAAAGDRVSAEGGSGGAPLGGGAMGGVSGTVDMGRKAILLSGPVRGDAGEGDSGGSEVESA